MNRFTRFAAATALAAAVAVGTAQPASADQTFVLDPGVGCSFGLEIKLIGGNLDRETIGSARVISAGSTGTLIIRNTDTGESVSFPSRGVGINTTTSADGTQTFRYGGQLLLVLFDTDVPAGPSTTLYTGRVVFTVTPDGITTLQKSAGRQINVCAELGQS
jgi:hypothetical protein